MFISYPRPSILDFMKKQLPEIAPPKDARLNIKIAKTDLAEIRRLAHKFADGNVSELIRWSVMTWRKHIEGSRRRAK